MTNSKIQNSRNNFFQLWEIRAAILLCFHKIQIQELDFYSQSLFSGNSFLSCLKSESQPPHHFYGSFFRNEVAQEWSEKEVDAGLVAQQPLIREAPHDAQSVLGPPKTKLSTCFTSCCRNQTRKYSSKEVVSR